MNNRYPTNRELPDDIRPELKAKCDAIKANLQTDLADHLLFRHEIGRTIADILEDGDTYGDNPLPHIQRELKIPESRLIDHVNISRAFDRVQIKQLATRSVETGVPLTLSHLIGLTHVASKPKREKFIERIFNEGLSANQLQTEVFAMIGPRRKKGAGRKPKRPTSPMAGYTDLIKSTAKYSKKVSDVWEPVLNEVNEVTPDKLDDRFLAQMNEALDEVTGMMTGLELMRKSIEMNIRRTREVIALREHEQTDRAEGADEVAVYTVEFDDETVDANGEEEAEIEEDDDPFEFHGDDDEFDVEAA